MQEFLIWINEKSEIVFGPKKYGPNQTGMIYTNPPGLSIIFTF
jgi:hypothetical protein